MGRRNNKRDAVVSFRADMDEAREYVSSDALFSLRKGTRYCVKDPYKKENKEYDAIIRQDKRTRSHNGICTPLSYATKPKTSDFSHDTIRKPAFEDYLAEMALMGIVFE